MALLATQNVVLTGSGLTPAYTAAAGGGDTTAAGDRVFLHVKNGGGSPITVTLTTPGTVSDVAVSDPTYSVTNAQERMIGPLKPQLFADPTTGLVSIAYSGVTTVTVGAFQLS